MKEKDIQCVFGEKNTIKGVFELKLCKKKSIRWDAVKEHQVKALLRAKHKNLYHKISDQPIFKGMKTRFNSKKPFDCFNIQSPAFVVVCFYVPRKKKVCYYIDIDDYINAWDKSDKKSYREEDIKDRASYKLNLIKQ